MKTIDRKTAGSDGVTQSTVYQHGGFALLAAKKLTPGTISSAAHNLGMRQAEPLIVMMDALISYASAYRCRFERPLNEDGFLGQPWLEAAKGVRALLNGDGAIAMKRGITTDSKDNGTVEAMFWNALSVAGFTEGDC